VGNFTAGIRSGDDHEDAFETVHVVPAGRGHLTNAYGASCTIAVTDN